MVGTAPDTRVTHESAAPLSHSSCDGVRVCVCVTSQPSPQLSSSRLRLVRLLLLSLRPIAWPGRVRPRRRPARRGRNSSGRALPGNACLHGPALALRLRLESHWRVCGEKARSGHSSQERRHRHSGQLEPRAAPWLEAGSRTRPISDSFLKSPVLVKMVALNRQHLQLPQVPTESLNHRIVRRTRDRPPSI